MLTPDEIRANVRAVEERVAAACKRAGRSRDSVKLIAVSKTFPAAAAQAALAAGITDLGENRVQEARDKKPEVDSAARWHLIGHLQSNKAKDAAKIFDVIQTIDSLELAQKLSRAATVKKDVLIEVNIGREEQKAGVDPDETGRLADSIRELPNLDLCGLMAIPPVEGDPRRHFSALRDLRDTLRLTELSMGMTEDFEVAIEEGSTMVRVGRAIFGTRVVRA
jgi:pyridoxal phosphate enzyme (YggS family)